MQFETSHVICGGMDRTVNVSLIVPLVWSTMTYSDLLLLAGVASLHDSHQMSVFTLLLGLRSSTGRVGDIDTVLGHDRETRQSSFGSLGGILLRLLRDASSGTLSWSRRSHAHGAIRGVAEGSRGAWRGGVDWRVAGGQGLGWTLCHGGIASPWGGEDIVCSDEGTGIEVDGGILVEVESDLRDLIGAGGGTGNVGVDQLLELAGVESRLELEGSTQEGLDLGSVSGIEVTKDG